MLDLSPAFDTVSHEILLDRLYQRYGITGSSVQELFASYLSSRAQFVQIECSRSSLRELNCGVPQGSVMGLCYMFCTPFTCGWYHKETQSYHLYADDTQLYMSFKLGSGDLLSSAKSSVEICVQENNNWMILDGLKLNEEKTELLLLSSRCRPSADMEDLI